jgi:2,3-bisphosphoglycerate-dependent phosphoglycerate mutase
MSKVIYLVRHCSAKGQDPAAELTPEGRDQAEALADFLSGRGIQQIVSSPFARAIETIGPLSARLGIRPKQDRRLIEAPLSTTDHADWLDRLRRTFSDFELTFDGGESSRVATDRAVSAVADVISSDSNAAVVVTHGRLLILLLKHFDPTFGYDEWKNLGTPDVFRLEIVQDEVRLKRVWR